MQNNKTKLSETELALMKDKNFFIHKQKITAKIISLFGDLNTDLKSITKEHVSQIPEEAVSIQGKISKGENYLGYPWIVLDYPRVFGKENTFAFRTMFWWGNYMMFTFHLSGTYFEHYKPAILKNLDSLKKKNIYLCTNENQWVHHLGKDNFTPIDALIENNPGYKEIIKRSSFLKLSKKLPLIDWNRINGLGCETLNLYFQLLKT